MANNTAKTGGIVAGAGCLFGLAPLIISFAAAAFGSAIGNVLHWYTLFTAPIGAVVVVVGLVVAIVGASKSTPQDLTRAAGIPTVSSAEASATTANVDTTTTPTEGGGVELPPLPIALARSVKLAYTVGFVVLLVSCVMRIILFQAGAGILTVFDFVPAFFAGWFVYLARNVHEGLQFLRLHRSQMIVSIAGCVVGLFPLLFLADNISMLSDPGIDQFQWGGTIITGLIPLAASVASLIFAEIARSRYRASFAKG